MPRRSLITLLGLTLLLLAMAALRMVAAPPTSGAPIFALPADSVEWEIRGVRVLIGVVVGSALAVSGVLLQALLRNPLAEPAILGLSAGAGLGVVVSIWLMYLATGSLATYSPPVISAMIGALGALAIVYALGQKRGLIDPVSLILVGVVVSVICGAGMAFFQHLLPAQGWAVSLQWMMGSIRDDVSWSRLTAIGSLALLGVLVGVRLGPAMDAATLDEDEARSVGAPIGALRLTLFALAGALTAGSVLLAGPIGFVGLVCPHAVRLLVGPSHRVLVVGSALAGGALIVGADALIRVIDLGAGRMPIGVLTALVGGPAFIWLLRRKETWS